jgi:hypothetical protein
MIVIREGKGSSGGLIPSALPEIVAVLGKLEAVLTPPTLTIGSFASQFRI